MPPLTDPAAIAGGPMTRRDRVYRALEHHDTDPVPYHVALTSAARARLADYTGVPDYLDHAGNHLQVCWYPLGRLDVPGLGPDHYADEFGVIFACAGEETDLGSPANMMIAGPDLTGYTMPRPNAALWRARLEACCAREQDTFLLASLGFAFFDRAWCLTGMENLLTYMVEAPRFVDELFEALAEFVTQQIAIALEYPVDAIHIADDWGNQRGLTMSPVMWRRFIKPHMARFITQAQAAGKRISLHSCGKIDALFPELIEMGLDVYQTVQPEVYDLARIKREYGRDLTFWGGIGQQSTLTFDTPEGVRRTVTDTLKLMGSSGGYIAGPSHDIVASVPPENVVALIETLRGQAG